MKYFELTKEEQKILENFEAGKLKRVADFEKAKRLYKQVASATLNKTRNINIRLPQKTLLKLKSKAAQEGIPYQTLVSSLLHKFANQ